MSRSMWFRRGVAGLTLAMVVAGIVAPAGAFAATRGSSKVGAASTVTILAEDDNIPGRWADDDEPGLWTAGAITYNDTVDSALDSDDVYAVWLQAGEVLSLSLTPPAGSDTGLYLYDSSAEDVASDPYLAESEPAAGDGGSPGNPVTTSLMAPVSDYYFVDVFAFSGSGAYALSMTVTRRDSDVRIPTSGGTLSLGTYPTIRGDVIDIRTGVTPSAATGDLYFYYSFDGLDWYPLAGVNYTGGQFAFPGIYQWRKTYYMVTLEGNSGFTSNSQVTKPYATKVVLTNPVAPTTMYKGKAKTVYGYLQPGHTSGSYPVRIYKYKKVSGSWKSYGYVKAKASNIYDDSDFGKSKYSVSMSLPSTGSWRLRAYAIADSQHPAAWSSSYDYVTVK